MALLRFKCADAKLVSEAQCLHFADFAGGQESIQAVLANEDRLEGMCKRTCTSVLSWMTLPLGAHMSKRTLLHFLYIVLSVSSLFSIQTSLTCVG